MRILRPVNSRDHVHNMGLLRILFCSWNVASTQPDESLTELLMSVSSKEMPDIYIIGLQEVQSDPVSKVKSAIMEGAWTDAIKELLSQKGYVQVKRAELSGQVLNMFSLSKHLPHIRDIELQYTKLTMMNVFWSKGAVSLSADIYGCRTCIIHSHLPAHLEAWEERNQAYHDIIADQNFESETAKTILDHHYVYWFGDLNYRIDGLPMETIKKMIQKSDLQSLQDNDQLCISRGKGDAFEGFEEGPITFSPTYKFNVDTDIYDTRPPVRVPAWCDRVLWKVKQGDKHSCDLEVNVHEYRSHKNYKRSDHKPVTAILTMKAYIEEAQPLVKFGAIDHWYCSLDGEVEYTVHPSVNTATWDWIGLFKINFKDSKDYWTYVWAVNGGESKGELGCRVVFNEIHLPNDPGRYMLAYYSYHADTFIAVSDPFKVLPPNNISEFLLS